MFSIGFQEPPRDIGCLLIFTLISEAFEMGVPRLTPAWQGLSIISQIAESFLGKLSSCPPSS